MDILKKIKLYIKVTNLSSIVRRYFVKNGMDGSMTALGVILGAWIVGVDQPNIIIGAGLGASVAMCISGLFGAYITEKAEQKRVIKKLEESMLSDLNGSIQHNASNFAPTLAGLIDGLSPAATAVISLIPFMLALLGVFTIGNAYIISLILTLGTLFGLGLYLGKIAKENIWLYGLQMLAAGIVISFIILLFG